MKNLIKCTLVASACYSSTLIGAESSEFNRCRYLENPIFKYNFLHSASVPERCSTSPCETKFAHWNSTIVPRIVSLEANKTILDSVNSVLEVTSNDLSRISGVQFDLTQGTAPNFFLIVLDDDLVELISNGSISGIDPSRFKSGAEKVYSEGGCSGTAFIGEGKETETIEKAIIYLNVNLTLGALEKCTKEEMINAMGLFGDPPGQQSLFDNGNIRFQNGKVTYSEETEVMLETLYNMAKFSLSDFDSYLKLRCGSIQDGRN
jgi:hypothetical protein